MKIEITERPGRCRWCGCTELRACGAGCSWANGRATLCSECVPLDTMIRTAAGRKQLAEAAATYDDEALAGPTIERRRSALNLAGMAAAVEALPYDPQAAARGFGNLVRRSSVLAIIRDHRPRGLQVTNQIAHYLTVARGIKIPRDAIDAIRDLLSGYIGDEESDRSQSAEPPPRPRRRR